MRSAEVAPPHPTQPLSGAVVDGSAVTFEWQSVPDAVAYGLQVAPDRQFLRDLLEVPAIRSTSIALHDSLPPADRPYFWRVRATTLSGETRWSPYGRFVVGSDAEVDAFRNEREAREAEQRRAEARERARKEAELDLIPFVQRDDTIPTAAGTRILGWTFVAAFLLVLASILLATIL